MSAIRPVATVLFSLAFALGLGASADASPPPNAPNVCSALACAEVFPLLNPAGRGFVVPEYTITERQSRSRIVADYGDFGKLRLEVAIIDLADCDGPASAPNVRLIRLEPKEYRGNSAECRRISLEAEPRAGVDESTLRSKLINVWLTAGHTIGTADGDIAMPVELRVDLSKSG
jgi:hypothetical protein